MKKPAKAAAFDHARLHPDQRGGSGLARDYIAKLENRIARLVAGQGAFSDTSDLYPKLRMAHCDHHYAFCLPRENAPTLILAIFHERMDLMTRLIDRLGTAGQIRNGPLRRLPRLER